jgi:hypothetical protein
MIVQCWAQAPEDRPRMATIKSRLCRLAGTLSQDPHRREARQRRRAQQLALSTSEGLAGTLRHRQTGQSTHERVRQLPWAQTILSRIVRLVFGTLITIHVFLSGQVPWSDILRHVTDTVLGTCLTCFPRATLTLSGYTKGDGTPTTPMRADGDILHTTTQTETMAEPARQRHRFESLSPERTPGLAALEARGLERSPSPARLSPRSPVPSSAISHDWRMHLNNWLQRHDGVGRLSVECYPSAPHEASMWTAISRGRNFDQMAYRCFARC